MRAASLLALASLALAACGGGEALPPPPPPGAIPAGEVIGSSGVSGRALLVGPPPSRQPLKITEAACRHGQTDEPVSESVVANPDGSLRNVVVAVKTGLGDRVFAPPGPAIVDQKGCIYVPHVISVQTNQVVTFLNSDPTLHNVHAVAKVNPAFNVGMAVKGQKVSRYFPKPEIVKLKCDVHSWMSAYVGVFEHPFHAVTGDEGTFAISGLPEGSYLVEAWHETYGTRSETVTLGEGEIRTVEFVFGG